MSVKSRTDRGKNDSHRVHPQVKNKPGAGGAAKPGSTTPPTASDRPRGSK